MTNCARAGGCAGSNYSFLTQKERDNETGLDYFLARYYSSVQGRFTSPDEFTGGPDELYYFVDDAAANPTFYADPSTPQSLNKYHYSLNNPLRYTDPDGHCPPIICVPERIARTPAGQQIIRVGGTVVTTVIVAASGALDKIVEDAGRYDTTCPECNWDRNPIAEASNPNFYAKRQAAKGGVDLKGNQSQGASNSASPGNNDEKPPFGHRGTQTTSKTMYQGKDGGRIDVENPNPGQRAGQFITKTVS